MRSMFQKEPLKARFNDTIYLLKHSFTIIEKDKDILRPAIHMFIFSSLLTTIFFISILTFITGTMVGVGVFLLLLWLFVLIPYSYFFYVRQKACQSWIVYNTIIGKDIDYPIAHKHTHKVRWTLRGIAFIDFIMGTFGKNKSNDKGIVSVLINLALAALQEVWDLLSHYMIPAIVIEQKKLKQIIPQLKKLKENVPAALVGVFGIDFVGNIIGMILGTVYIAMFAVAFAIGYLVALVAPSTAFVLGGVAFSWIPIFVIAFVSFLLGGVLNAAVHSVKTIYFTIFYTSLTRPKKMTSDMRKELTRYLKFGKR
jgi:hypothetical protein